MSSLTPVVVLALVLASGQCGVVPLVTVGQSLAAHAVDHSLAAQVIPAAPLLAAPAPLLPYARPPLVPAPVVGPAPVVAPGPVVAPAPAVAPAPLFAAPPAPAPFFAPGPLFAPAPARFAAPYAFPAPYFPLR